MRSEVIVGTTRGQLIAGVLAQVLAQATAGWTLVIHLVDWPNASVWVAAPLVAAIVVPFRHDGSLRDRATGNFSAAIVVVGLMWWEILAGGLGGIVSGGGFTLGVAGMLLIVSAAMFAGAGAMFWILRREGVE